MPRMPEPAAAPTTPTSGLVAPTGLVSPAKSPAFPSGGGLVPGMMPNAPNPNAVIPGTDFTILERPKRKAVILVFGDGGTGKTTFGLKFSPQPAVLIGFDGRSEYVEQAMKNAGHPVPAVQIPPPSVLVKSDNVKSAARAALDQFFRNYDGAINASLTGKVRTIVIDTGSELGEIITLAIRGTLDNVKGDYGKSKDQINQIWWKVFAAARFTGNAHVVILSRASSIWENNEPTGDFRARVHDTVRDAVDFSVHIRLGNALSTMGMLPGAPAASAGGGGGMVGLVGMTGGSSGNGSGIRTPKEFELVVKKSGNVNPVEATGLVFRQSDWGDVGPFAYACTQLMPGSTVDDWR